MAERSILELLLRSKKEGDAAKKTEAELKQLSKASGEAGKAAEKLNLGMLAVKGAVIGAGLAFLRSIPDILEQGAALERADYALIGYTGSAENAALVLDSVRSAARGAISDFTASQMASRLFAMGLAETAEEAGKLTEIAITLGASMGKGPEQAFEDFSLMLANQSIPRLDTFGISAGKVRVRMGELAKEFPGMTREAAFMTATMDDAEKKLKALNEAGFDAVSSVDKLQATVENLKNAGISWIAEGLEPWIDGVMDVIQAHEDLKDRLLEDGNLAEYTAEKHQAGANRMSHYYRVATAQVEQDLYNLEVAMGKFDGASLAEGFAGIAGPAADAAEEIGNISVKLSEVTEKELGRAGLDILNQAWEDGTITQEQYEEGLRAVGTEFLGLTESQVNASVALTKMRNDFDLGTASVERLIDELYRLRDAANALPSSYYIPPTRGSRDPNEPRFQHGADFVVPPGYPNDSFRMRVQSGEHVQVTPPGEQPPEGAGGGLHIHGDIIIQSELTARVFGEKFREFGSL